MNKQFFTICFIALMSISNISTARVLGIGEESQEPATDMTAAFQTPKEGMPNPDNLDEVISFFRNRFETAPVSTAEQTGSMDILTATDVQHSAEYIKQMQEQKKTIFEKIYDKAIEKISGTSNETAVEKEELRFYELIPEQPQTAQNQAPLPNIPLVNVTLPGGRKVVAPAREHIPYLLVSLNILPNGLIEVNEEVTVVANGQKLRNGLVRIIPKFTSSRLNIKKKLDVKLLDAEINNQPIPHILEEIGNNYYIKAKKEYQLAPGVYTYHFRYLVDRKLWYYDDFAELYWDIAGRSWNLVITSANAVVSLPEGQKFLGQNALVGQGMRLFANRSVIVSLSDNALGFASTTPLLPGEGMHLLVSLDKNFFLEPDFNQYVMWFITDYGNILIAFLGFIAVLISYILSWRYLKNHKPHLLGSFKLTAPIARLLIKNNFDKIAFVSGLLELYRKNVIDIQKQDSSLMLIKRTDQVQMLNQGEKNVMKHLFASHESVITADDRNLLKFQRAKASLERYTGRMVKLLKWQLNIGYLFFSVMMLLLTEAGIAGLSVNPWQTGLILISFSVTLTFYIWMFRRPTKHGIKKYILRSVAVFFILASVLFTGVYISFISALLLTATLSVIFEYSALFGARSGLLKSKVKEAEELGKYLQRNAPQLNNSIEFSRHQPEIYAFDLVPFYPQNSANTASYKLDLAQTLEQMLN